jgi:hypothetical protein
MMLEAAVLMAVAVVVVIILKILQWKYDSIH